MRPAKTHASAGGEVYIGAFFIVALIVTVTLLLVLLPGTSSTAAAASGGGGSGSLNVTLPLITPPVRAAAPIGLKGLSSGSAFLHKSKFTAQSIDPTAIKDRFFNGSGPTDLFGILQAVDDRIAGINDRIDIFPCMNDTLVPYNLSAWVPTPQFYAQCSEGNATFFTQWALDTDNGIFYVLVNGGDGIVAAQAFQDLTTGAVINESIWFSVGTKNRNGSHAVVQIVAHPKEKAFEMSVAGAGIGFCGAQLMANATVMNFTGSVDMGATCVAADTNCVLSLDLTSVGTSACIDVSDFTLPALGRQNYSTFGASAYPGGAANQVVLSVSGNDACFFGPSEPTVDPAFCC